MVRTRFAPSPTGFLHVGGVRTALFCWLYARRQGGQFVLRIEDTDTERSTQESVDAILEGMAWLGLDWDQGPFYQTQRLERYREVAEQLLERNQAYYCYCSKERLETLRAGQLERKEKPRYDGHCRHLNKKPAGGSFVIRFKTPQEGAVYFEDAVKGRITVLNSELDDLIMVRSDGMPTYNFAVVVDDWDMDITHVIRGDDHVANTSRQIHLFEALGAHVPIFAHVPMILGDDGKRLSKRHGAISVLQYREAGFMPEALLNYLVRLGWSYGDQEIFSLAQMVQQFDIKDLNKAAAAFNTQKLLWLNQHYIKTLDVERIAQELQWLIQARNFDTRQGPSIIELINIHQGRVQTLDELLNKSLYFYQEPILDVEAKAAFTAELKLPFEALIEAVKELKDWQAPVLHSLLQATAEQFGLKMGKLAPAVRIALTGSTVSPSIDLTMALIGQPRVLQRLQKALSLML